MQDVHSLLANSVVMYLFLVAAWGLIGYARGFGVGKNYAGALVVGEIALLAQGLVGGWLALAGATPSHAGMHYLYGVGALLGLPVAYSFLRGRDDRRALLWYGLAALFVFGMALRALTTG